MMRCLAMLLVITITFPQLTIFANGNTRVNQSAMDQYQEFLALTMHTSSMLHELESLTGINVYEAALALSSLNVSQEWMDEAVVLMNEFANENNNGIQQHSIHNTVERYVSMSRAVTHSISVANASVARFPHLNLCPDQEASFMFISHFVDRPDPFWLTGEYNALLDGHDRRRFLAHQITSEDRRIYSLYMQYSSMLSVYQAVVNASASIIQFAFNAQTILNTTKVAHSVIETIMSTGDNVLQYMSIYRNFAFLFQLFQDGFINDLTPNQLAHLFSYNQNMLNDIPRDAARLVVASTLSLIFALLVPGFNNFLGIGISLALLSFNIAASFIQYALWVSMRVTFNGRHAIRMWQDLFNTPMSIEDIDILSFCIEQFKFELQDYRIYNQAIFNDLILTTN